MSVTVTCPTCGQRVNLRTNECACPVTAPVPATLAALSRAGEHVCAERDMPLDAMPSCSACERVLADALDAQAARITQLEAALRMVAEYSSEWGIAQKARAALSATTGGTT